MPRAVACAGKGRGIGEGENGWHPTSSPRTARVGPSSRPNRTSLCVNPLRSRPRGCRPPEGLAGSPYRPGRLRRGAPRSRIGRRPRGARSPNRRVRGRGGWSSTAASPRLGDSVTVNEPPEATAQDRDHLAGDAALQLQAVTRHGCAPPRLRGLHCRTVAACGQRAHRPWTPAVPAGSSSAVLADHALGHGRRVDRHENLVGRTSSSSPACGRVRAAGLRHTLAREAGLRGSTALAKAYSRHRPAVRWT